MTTLREVSADATIRMNTLRAWFSKGSGTDRRREPRKEVKHMVAYYWNGENPVPHTVRAKASTLSPTIAGGLDPSSS
jgi:hypothetical protein